MQYSKVGSFKQQLLVYPAILHSLAVPHPFLGSAYICLQAINRHCISLLRESFFLGILQIVILIFPFQVPVKGISICAISMHEETLELIAPGGQPTSAELLHWG